MRMFFAFSSTARRWAVALLAVALGLAAQSGMAAPEAARSSSAQAAQRNVLQWLQRWQQAASSVAYAGTLAMSGEHGNLRSARVWHAVAQGRQIERVDNLSGPPRSIFRTDDAVHVFHHDRKQVTVRTNMPRFGSLFPGMVPLSTQQQAEAARRYQASYQGQERVANQLADVVEFAPQDDLRYAYRFWSDRRTGLLLKWQMLQRAGAQAAVLREVAFSDVQIGAPLEYRVLDAMMRDTAGYQVERKNMRATSLQQQGWAMRTALPGYFVTDCYIRQRPQHDKGVVASEGEVSVLITQCVLSDGLAGMSLFMAPPGGGAPGKLPRARGATNIRMQQYAGGHSVTAVGEVPPAALQGVLERLYRP